jgi:hypothetical protein
MQIIFDAGCTPDLYQLQGESFGFPDMSGDLCPQCKGGYLSKHGFYGRHLITIGFEGEIKIRRFYCKEACGRTVSLLPSFCHPKRTYGILVIIGFLIEFYIKMSAVCAAVANYLAETGVECSRQLLLQYRRRIEKNLNSLAMAITAIYSLHTPLVTEKTDTKEKVRQLLTAIACPEEYSLKIFGETGTTYLTKQAV